jgi:uncharacterized membrane protein YhaH (DUF805 family)/Tfp pilus assembly protein PilE
MNTAQSDDIRFFDLNSRIGRLRYLAYSMGLLLLTLVAALLCGMVYRVSSGLGMALFAIMYIAMLVLSIAFGVRRMHDQDRSGWWMLMIIIPVANLVLLVLLLFVPGSDGENSFGEQPPPNSGWVIAGAVAYIGLIPLAGILAAIAIPAYQDYFARAQTSEAIQLADGAEQPVVSYHDKNKAWPTDLSPLYPKNPSGGIGLYSASITAVNESDSSFGIMVAMKQTGVSLPIAGKRVEIWTVDGGSTWQCGPASMDPLEPKYLPASCRSSGAL